MELPDVDSMSKQDLARELLKRREVERRFTLAYTDSPERLVHDLRLHQVELEMQNRELQETQGLLEKSRDRYADLYDFAPVGYCAFSPTGTILEANLTTAAMLGIPREKLINRQFGAFVSNRQAFRTHLKRCHDAGIRVTSELELAGPNGARAIQVVSELTMDNTGAATYRSAIVDISALKESEARLRFLSQAGETLASSLDYDSTLTALVKLAIPLVADVCVLDARDENQQVRRLAIAFADPTQHENLAKCSHDFTPPTSWSTPQARVLASGRPELIHDARISSQKDAHEIAAGDTPIVSLMIVPMISRNRTLGVLTFATSESGRRYGPSDLAFAQEIARRAGVALDNALLYRDAQRAVHARANLQAVVSHDLRTPLAAILMRVALLLDDVRTELEQTHWIRESLESIRRSAQAMNRLIEDLLDVAGIESRGVSIESQRQSVAGILKDALDMMQPLALNKGIVLTMELASPELGIGCDRERIVQSLMNLASNAIKFTPSGGRVNLRAEARGNDVVFSVRDSGPGIPAEQQSHIFERFWQAPKTAHLGRGLGLSIVKGIVEAHGGKVWVESTPGAGSTLSFALPNRMSPLPR